MAPKKRDAKFASQCNLCSNISFGDFNPQRRTCPGQQKVGNPQKARGTSGFKDLCKVEINEFASNQVHRRSVFDSTQHSWHQMFCVLHFYLVTTFLKHSLNIIGCYQQAKGSSSTIDLDEVCIPVGPFFLYRFSFRRFASKKVVATMRQFL